MDLVINYFNPALKHRLTLQTLHVASLYQESTEPVRVIIANGSGVADSLLEEGADRIGAVVVNSESRLSFGEGYNLGIRWAQAHEPAALIALSANDIYASPNTLRELRNCLESNADVGCTMPYLTHSDFWLQRDYVYTRTRKFNFMTLNLNLFRAADLQAIGGVPEYLSGYYNDIEMALSLRERGLSVALCFGYKVYHQHRSTVNSGTSANYDADAEIFFARHPLLRPLNERASIRLSTLGLTGMVKLLYRIKENYGSPFMRRLSDQLIIRYMKLEKWWFQKIYYPIIVSQKKGYKFADPYEGFE